MCMCVRMFICVTCVCVRACTYLCMGACMCMFVHLVAVVVTVDAGVEPLENSITNLKFATLPSTRRDSCTHGYMDMRSNCKKTIDYFATLECDVSTPSSAQFPSVFVRS